MFEKKLGEGLGKITKATLRAFTGKSRMTQQQYYTALDEYNAEVDRLHKEERKQKERERKRKSRAKQGQKYYEENIKIYVPKDNEKPLADIFNILKNNYVGKSIMIIGREDDNIVQNVDVEVDTDFNNWWKKTGVWIFQPNSDTTMWDEHPDIKYYFYEANKKINTTKIIQYFKEGNVNCLLKPIDEWAHMCLDESKSEGAKKRYNAIINKIQKISLEIGDNGVCETELNRITNDLQVDISIEYPVYKDDKYIVESKSNRKALKHFIMRNTRLDHVELNEFEYLNNVEIVDKERLYEIKCELDNNNTHYTFETTLDGIRSISTLDKTYKLSDTFYDMCNQFEIDTGLNECYIDDIDDKELSMFVKAGTHYNSTVDFNNFKLYDMDNINHIDMESAYANYSYCDYYEGFLGKITDFRKTDKIMGVGLYEIYDLVLSDEVKELNDMLHIFMDNNVYTSPELKYLTDNDCTYKIRGGCWGIKPLKFEMCEAMYEKYDGIKGYAKYIGKCDSHYLNKKMWCNGDEELAKVIPNCVYYQNNAICISYPKKHNYHLGHITAFITAYQRLQVLDQLMRMNLNNIVRVCVDGIYYVGDCKYTYPFGYKTKKTFENVAGDSYVSDITNFQMDWKYGEYKQSYHKELHRGEGGNGKTHKNLLDNGNIRLLYLSPSWKLATNKRNEYGCASEVWSNILTDDPEKWGIIKRRYNVFLIDEVSMMSETDKQSIFNRYDNIKLIFCGDIGFQAPPFNKTGEPVIEINTKGFDVIIDYNTNYRFKCNKLKALIAEMRYMIAHCCPTKIFNEYVINQLNDRIISDNDVQQMYNINDMILSRSHEIKDKYTNMFQHLNKWYVLKNTRLYQNGCIVIGDKPDTTCEIRHSYTIHSIQGETASHKLFINIEKYYDPRLLYTAVSRAKRLDQIYLIK